MSTVWTQGVSTTSAPTANGSGNGREWIAISLKNPFEGGTRPRNEQPRPPGRPQRPDPPQLISICLHCHLEECHPESRECPLNRQYRRRMEIPKDLAELARTMTYQELGDHYCVSPDRAKRWCHTLGLPRKTGRPKRPRPPRFKTLYLNGVGIHKLMQYFQVGSDVVHRWIQETEEEMNHDTK